MKKLIALVAVVAFLASAAPALANGDGISIKVENDNTTVKNYVVTTASSGGNSADGGSASTKVKDSGNITGDKNDWNTTGGGNVTSDGGNGGKVKTGNAVATADVLNDVNSTNIKVKTSCECDEGKIKVKVQNTDTTVKNKVITTADTGLNSADGGSASTKVKNNGNITGDKNDDNVTGGGNTDSNGGDGGKIKTGTADSWSTVINVVNSTVIRVKKI
ncbi:MAG: hypothetical protein CEO19_374 [Parcubacteria group bacterium Gr01-1014_73]|nr:MAG: hypothetical protein CEO19_374 [Parcubacteria group bacterium Gr01-1014_73]